ncbi:hypothetical protein GmHk_08G023538 [Glycine max]|nr:hypothetical protein GmHk_08G023538 [Glycine max]
MPEDSSFFTYVSFRASVLVAVIETLQGYVNVYEGLNVAELIKLKVDKHHTLRRPLQMRKQKPVPIKLLNPKFEKPGGSHALPEGIIFDTSDLEMRNLWDLSMTKTIENKENASTNLFAMAVGIKQKDLVNKMVKKVRK